MAEHNVRWHRIRSWNRGRRVDKENQKGVGWGIAEPSGVECGSGSNYAAAVLLGAMVR